MYVENQGGYNLLGSKYDVCCINFKKLMLLKLGNGRLFELLD